MIRVRVLLFLLTAFFVLGAGYLLILFARGHRFDTKTLTFRPEGLFVITSSPDGAKVLIDNKLESATNATISLPPDTYEIELKKEGYLSWKKTITIKKEEVTKIEVQLFPAAPSLSSLTFAGAQNPVLSDDGTKIAFGVLPSDKADMEKVGIWIMDLGDLPIGFSKDPRRVTNADPTNLSWAWSPDSRELLVKDLKGYYLLDSGTLTILLPIYLSASSLSETLSNWQEDIDKKYQDKFKEIPEKLRSLLTPEKLQGKKVIFSPDKKKILYTASQDFQIPEELISSLPGSSTQKEERNIKKGNTYVYDSKEDRNFLVFSGNLPEVKNFLEEASAPAPKKPSLTPKNPATPKTSIRWFPTSNHLVLSEEGKITIIDYDGTNPQTVWGGPYTAPYAIPFPNTTRLLILTNLGAGDNAVGNLYAISLR